MEFVYELCKRIVKDIVEESKKILQKLKNFGIALLDI